MTLLLTFFGVIITLLLYKRYFPVMGVKCDNLSDIEQTSIQVVDLRDYNISYKDPIKDSINIPIAYLKRFYNELPSNENIHIIAQNNLEKNLGVRFLKQKGYNVIGFTLIDCPCEKQYKKCS